MTHLVLIDYADALTRCCEGCGAAFTVKFPSERKRFCSYSCSAKSRAPKADAANPNWRGGKSSHPLYYIYHDMISRCHTPTHKRYADYGARGIAVCERWRADFWAFVADMGERPEGLTLDRIDNDEGYEPGNCRWATYQEQRHNRRAQKPREKCPNGHRYTPETTRTSPRGHQECAICADATKIRSAKANASRKRRLRERDSGRGVAA